MPVINFNYHDLCRLIGEEVPKDVLVERIPMLGADMQDTTDDDEMSVEFFPSRPDLFSVEGLARALRTFLGFEKGMRNYDVEDSGMEMWVDPSVKSVRPEIAAAVVWDVDIDDAFIRSLMEVQEKLHITIGRKRSKVAIGVHDLDTVRAPFLYSAVDPESKSFVPLGKTESWNLQEILEMHEKGRDYAHLMAGRQMFPLITDADQEVISFPPIINGTLTTVTESTRNILIEMTGTDRKAVDGAMNILVTALAERGGRIATVRMMGEEERVTPDLTSAVWSLDVEECNRFLGTSLDGDSMADCLRSMGHEAQVRGGMIEVIASAVRQDLIHPVDLMEDVAIGHGYQLFGSTPVTVQTYGSEMPFSMEADRIRDIMVGLSYFEVTTLILSNPYDEFTRMGREPERVVKVSNPITEEHSCMRASLVPSMMRVLRRNKHRDLPQRIFEVGDVLDWTVSHRHVAALCVHSKASFTEMKSITESLLREMGIDYELMESEHPVFIPGRGASIVVNGEERGHFGEMSAAVMASYEIGYPVTLLEYDLGPKLP